MATGIRFWHYLSQPPILGLQSYPTVYDAYAANPEICANPLGQPIGPDDFIIEPHEFARSVFLTCRICAVHSIVGEEATTMAQGQTLAKVVEPELLAARPFILDFVQTNLIADAFLDRFVREFSLKPDVTADTLRQLMTVAHLTLSLHEGLSVLAAQACTPSSSKSLPRLFGFTPRSNRTGDLCEQYHYPQKNTA